MKRISFVTALLLAACNGEGLVDAALSNYDYKQQVWTHVDVGVQEDLYGMQWLDANTGYIVGDKGLVLKTADGGQSFAAGYPAVMTNKALVSVSFVTPAQGFVASKNEVYVTQDGGNSWKLLTDFKTQFKDEILRARFVTAGVGYVAGKSKAYQTLDGGASWTPLALVNVRDFRPTQSQVYAGGGNIYRGVAGGGWDGLLAADKACTACSSWVDFTSPTDGWAVITGTNAISGPSSFAVLKTSDAGTSWSSLPIQNQVGKPLGTYLRGASYDSVRALRFTDAQNGWLIFGGGLLSTTDGGQTWIAQHQAFLDLIGQKMNTYHMTQFYTFGFNDLQATSATSAWVVGQQGRIYKYTGAPYPAFHEK